MPLSVPETFEWMRERLDSDAIELAELRTENERLAAENVRLALELARRKTQPVRDEEARGEDVNGLPELKLDAASTPD